MVFISAYVCLTIHNKSASLVWLPPWAQTSFWWCHYFKRYFLVAFCGLQPVIFALLSHTNTTSQQTRPQLFGGFLARIMRSRKNFHCYPFAVFPFLPAGRQQTRVQTGRTSPFVPDHKTVWCGFSAPFVVRHVLRPRNLWSPERSSGAPKDHSMVPI